MENKTKKQDSENKCPYCSSKNILKRGVRKTENRGNIQRFSCKDCKKRFVKHDAFYGKRILTVLKQRGKIGDIVRDKGRIAQPPGKRISKAGKPYWETRKNRTDALNSMT